ncbi:MAG: NADH:ubiquinone oxidoreductase [Lentisphaerae bacterium]|nr:NADH:ubiquinone oxidoreductase [Lentisphaerota bacterium]
MSKPRVAIFDFACCEGCQLQIVNLEEEILDLLTVVQPVEWREAMSDHSESYDIAIVEGSITRPEDEARLKQIRERAGILIALGACATLGGVNKLKDNFELEDVKRCVYGEAAAMPHLATARVKAVDEVVKVDFKVHGCPINNKEFAAIVRCLATGKTPVIPSYPVCVECKKRENVCRYEYQEICLGPLTRAGCNAPCPSAGFWCFGCRGAVDEPNVNAARDVMARYGRTVEDLKSRMLLFGSRQEFANV